MDEEILESIPAEPDREELAVRTALEKLLADLPGLRQSGKPSGRGLRVGAGVTGDTTPEEDLLRAAFGIR